MPLRRSGVRGGHRDIVDQVENKLKLNLPRKILETARAHLRVLKIRHPIGSFGKNDNETKRFCALLEYVLRDNDIASVTMDRLSKAAFMNTKDFREFHEKIGNFRHGLSIATKPKTVVEKNPAGTALRTRKKKRKVDIENGIVFHKSSIPFLTIQLGAFVPNASV